MITISELNQVTTKDVEAINALLPQLSDTAKPVTYQMLLDIVKDNAVMLFLMKDGQNIIGMGSLFIFNSVLGKHARLQEMVVDSSYRGKGLGSQLTQYLIDEAKKLRVKEIELSSRPSREAANKIYQKLGFEKHETNVYRMKL